MDGMTPQQLINAAYQVQLRWPDSQIVGFYGNATVTLDVEQDGFVVGYIECSTGKVSELTTPRRSRGNGGGVTFIPSTPIVAVTPDGERLESDADGNLTVPFGSHIYQFGPGGGLGGGGAVTGSGGSR